jgi:competence ComEA-like helix-hairpin-helix protein
VRARYIGICGLIALAALPEGANGQATGQFGITPARRNLVGRPPVVLQPTQVFNRTRTTYDVRVLPVLLSQRVDGSFDFRLSPRELHAASLILSARPQRFTMTPNTRRDISLTWALLPRRTRAAYVGLLVQGVPRGVKQSQIRNQLRLLGVNFFRLPGRYFSRGTFTGLRGEQFGRRLRFFARVRNNGQVVASPRRTLFEVLDSTGRSVYRTRWPGDVILPGAQRDFPIVVHARLPAGRYRAVARMRLGRSRDQATLGFGLVATNRLPTPKVVLSTLNARGEIHGSAHVTATVSSVGNAPASPSIRLELFSVARGTPGRHPLASKHVTFEHLKPDAQEKLDVDLGGKLEKAPYRVVATYTPERGAAPVQLTSDFVPVPHRGFLDRLGDWLDGNLALIIAVLAAVAIGALAYLFVRSRRRYERELAAVRLGGERTAAAAPKRGGRVDLNTASEEELHRLPGVGAAMAARIVAERKSGGPFASVADLRRVAGVGDAKIKALRGKATVAREPAPKEPDRRDERRRRREEAARRRADAADRRRAERREREREEAERRKREEAVRREREEAVRREREEAVRREREEAERREREEAGRRDREAMIRLQREEAERREREVALAAREEAARRERGEAERLAREEAERGRREEAEEQRRLRAEAEERARAQEADQRERAREGAEWREREAPPAPAQGAPAERPPPWADPTPVDLNTADVAELTRLPGIGRGAAKRIIAHRESNGRFASVRDLEQVEGFDAGRVARVARRATVS